MARRGPIGNSRKLLVNADDFGLSAAINAGIVSSFVNGIVRSTSIVASGKAFEEAVSLSRSHSALGVGVHLTLVEEHAVAPGEDLPTLAPRGLLPAKYGSLMKGVATGGIKLRDIEVEFRAQIEKCLAAGLRVTHLDSHQHTHALPPIFSLVTRLGKYYKIPGIRIPRGWPKPRDFSADRFAAKCVLCMMATADSILLSAANITAERFAGLFESGALDEAALLQILKHVKAGSTELVCHPAENDESGRYAKWNQRRQMELAALTSERVKASVSQLGLQLINYRELVEDSSETAGCAA